MKYRRLGMLVVFLTIVVVQATAPVSPASETVYFEETFENESIGSVVYETDFESGTDGWSGDLVVYKSSALSETHGQEGSVIRTTARTTVGSRWNGYKFRQRGYVEVDEDATYHVYVRGDAGYPDGQFDDRIEWDRIAVDGRKHPLDTGRETHFSLSLSPGNHTIERNVQYKDDDGGLANGSVSIDRIAIVRDTRRHVGIWETDGFPIYTETGIDGTSLFARSVTASINASPAQNRDPVVVEFDLQTASEPADWSIEQSGHTIADSSVGSDNRRHIKRRVSLQTGRFTLDVDSQDTVAIDNLRVVGYRARSAEIDQLQPSVPALERAAPKQGYDTLVGSLHGLLDLGLDTATYLALVGLVAGCVLFVVGRSRTDRAPVLVLGGCALLVSVLVFAPMLNTVAWIFSGTADQPSLEDPDLAATTVLYRGDFEAGSLAATDWQQVSGEPSDAYVDTSDDGSSRLVLREGAVVETAVPVGSGVDSGVLSFESRVESNVNQAPPDEDALSIEVESDGESVLDDPTAVVATGGDATEASLQRRVSLTGSNVTIRFGAMDTNGGDGRARVDLTHVLLRGAP